MKYPFFKTTNNRTNNLDHIKTIISLFQEDLKGNPIEMGGFCQEPFIFKLSLSIYTDKLSELEKKYKN